MEMCKIIVLWIYLAVNVQNTYSQSDPEVKTPLGSVQGRHIKSYEGRTVTAFEGIPYAKPPVGDLRFKEPVPVEKWPDNLVASKTHTCMQYSATTQISDVLGDEDCLYLNVYIPREAINGRENFDVVIHIHGGAFLVGDPKSVAAPDYIMDRDLIYVTMNYRLGILGFLSTEDEVVPGNNGLKDQVLAMKWVKENIKFFGGNPDSITLTGTSAGAASVHFHYLSPLSKGLFDRGISHSGTALNTWTITKNPRRNAKKLGQQVGCDLEDSKELVNCLRSKPVRDVVLANANFFLLYNLLPPTPFGPVIEHNVPGAFLPDHPYKLILEGKINDYPWITSSTKHEGIAPVGFILQHGKLQELENRWLELAPHALNYNDTVQDADKEAIAKIIKAHYLQDEPISDKNIYNLIELFSDRYFHIDTIKAICLQAAVAKSPVYYYYFTYYIDMPVSYKANLTVVAHGDDSKLLYHQYDNPQELSDSDRKMKNIFIDFLYRYASTGKPDFKGVTWKPIFSRPEIISYMHIKSADGINRVTGVNLEPFIFWNNLPLRENEKLFLVL